jgi:nucleoside-diphosphate-sugar epimerase
MKLLLIGGLGNLGSALISYFKYKNALEIFVLDDQSRIKYEITDLISQSNLKFLDSRSTVMNKALINELKIDIVIDLGFRNELATNPSDKSARVDPNLAAAMKVSEACIACKIPLIYTSSTSVYHDLTGEVNENSLIHNVNSTYSKSKLEIENYLMNLPQLKFVILRLGSVHGVSKGMHFETAVNKFCLQYFNKDEITVWQGALNVKRPFLSLLDFVRAIEFIIYYLGFKNQIYNLATKSWSTQEIISILEKIGGLSARIEFQTKSGFSPESIFVSTDKFKETNFNFIGSLEVDISDTLKFLKGKL